MSLRSDAETFATAFLNAFKNIFLVTGKTVFDTKMKMAGKDYLLIQLVKELHSVSLGRGYSKAGTIVTVSSRAKKDRGRETRVLYKSTKICKKR